MSTCHRGAWGGSEHLNSSFTHYQFVHSLFNLVKEMYDVCVCVLELFKQFHYCFESSSPPGGEQVLV